MQYHLRVVCRHPEFTENFAHQIARVLREAARAADEGTLTLTMTIRDEAGEAVGSVVALATKED